MRRFAIARPVAVLMVFAACAYVLRGVMAALCWAVLIAVSTWPLHDRIRALGRRPSPVLSAGLLTAAAVVLLLFPLAYLTVHGLHEMPALLRVWTASKDAGLPAPVWLERLPFIGNWALMTWNAQIADPGALRDFVHGLTQHFNFQSGRGLITELGHRAMSLFFSILALYFLFLHGDHLAAQVRSLSARTLGRPGVRTLDLAVRAVRGTVNGMVLVALAMATVMSIAYAIAGVPHAALWGLLTGLLGIVPFGAALALVVVTIYLMTLGAMHTALALAAFGAVLIFVTDHFVRPLFISGPSGIPLVLALLGIVGGLETFGILGIFVGPTLVAIAVAVWRQLAGKRVLAPG